jgi:UDP-N-acetylglucosamine 4-epimerase
MIDGVKQALALNPQRWLVTGAAGFIGSHLLEELLRLDQQVVGVDNFSTGKRENLVEVHQAVSPRQWERLRFIEGDIRDPATCQDACRGVQTVLHQAALGSVPRSIENPLDCHDNNVTGTLNLLVAAREERVPRLVYASSSAVYGDDQSLPKLEKHTGFPLSPYAVSKQAGELYAGVFASLYGLKTVGLRYFNVFGPRQDPNGAYAAVIPRWIASLINDQQVTINGTGETSRDFCYVANVVQANLLAAYTDNPLALSRVYNVAVNQRTTLNELFAKLRARLVPRFGHVLHSRPRYGEFRKGDVLHSLADIERAEKLLGYRPTHSVDQGLDAALDWYIGQLA